MFIRWKKRACTRRGRGATYSAYLVQAKRVDGKPRQEVLVFLGNLTTYSWQKHMNQRARERFLQRAMKRLTNYLGYLQQVEVHRLALAEALARKVDQFIADEEHFRRSAVIGTTITLKVLQEKASS